MYVQYDLINRGTARLRGVRTERWKYVRCFNGDFQDELYDLERDPGENRNLLPIAPTGRVPAELDAVRRKLDAELMAWMRSVNHPLLR